MQRTEYLDGKSFPKALIPWVVLDTYDRNEDPLRISATTIIRSPRYIIAEARKKAGTLEDKYLPIPELSKLVAAKIGTSVHGLIESSWQDESYKDALLKCGYSQEDVDGLKIINEKRYEKLIEGSKYTLSGKVDLIINGHLHDVKTTSTFNYVNECSLKKYILQASMYKYLAGDDIADKDTFSIDYIFTKFNSMGDAPKSPVLEENYKFLTDEEIENYLKEKVNILDKYWDKPLEEIPCCTLDELYTSKPKYKVYTNAVAFVEGKRASKVFSDYPSAVAYSQRFTDPYIHVDRGLKMTCPYCEINTVDLENALETSTLLSKPLTSQGSDIKDFDPEEFF